MTYCHDLPGLLDAMELLEGEKKEDFYEVRELIVIMVIYDHGHHFHL